MTIGSFETWISLSLALVISTDENKTIHGVCAVQRAIIIANKQTTRVMMRFRLRCISAAAEGETFAFEVSRFFRADDRRPCVRVSSLVALLRAKVRLRERSRKQKMRGWKTMRLREFREPHGYGCCDALVAHGVGLA